MLEMILAKAVVGIATAAVTYITHAVGDFIKTKTKNEKAKAAIEVVDRIIVDSVKATEQTLKAELQRDKNGKLDKNEAKDLLGKTVSEILSQVPKKTEKEMQKMIPDVVKYTEKKVESTLHDLKGSLSSVIVDKASNAGIPEKGFW